MARIRKTYFPGTDESVPATLESLTTEDIATLGELARMEQAGIVANTEAEGYVPRTIVAAGDGIEVSRGDGQGGDPQLRPGNDLKAIEGLDGLGYPKRLGSNSWALVPLIPWTEVSGIPDAVAALLGPSGAELGSLANLGSLGLVARTGLATHAARSIAVPSALLGISDPDGVAGDPTITLPVRAANLVFAGPTTGADAAPAFRGLVADDIPDLSSLYQPRADKLDNLAAGTVGTSLAFTGDTLDTIQDIRTTATPEFSGLLTGAPSGGTAKPFKVGAAATVSPTAPDRTIEIEIDGTTYYLHAKTTND